MTFILKAELVAQRCSLQKGVLFCTETFTIFTKKYLWWILFFIKIAVVKPATLLKKTLESKCFVVIFLKILRITLFKERLQRLLLQKYGYLLGTDPCNKNTEHWLQGKYIYFFLNHVVMFISLSIIFSVTVTDIHTRCLNTL